MDSMRSLDTSLPTSSSTKTQRAQPPEQLLQAFKAAALSVTNLYKTAATGQSQARQSGYQDALDDLLIYLDKENLGLDDGEGWKVRKWATERLDGAAQAQSPGESDDDGKGEVEVRARSSSPTIPRKQSRDIQQTRYSTRSASPPRTESAPPTAAATSTTILPTQASMLPKVDAFTFRSAYPYPIQQDTVMDSSEHEPSSFPLHSSQQEPHAQSVPSSTPSLRVEVVPRHLRSGGRHGAHSNRGFNRASATVSALGTGAGFKRKIPFGEFFDIGSFNNGKDGGTGGGGGGGKKGRFT
ncbi:MAG: hypothetical protein M1836_002742 [Candelina mexicana]|nr:MAG: hypothetical protein M1836_002742 [Candelina mexicana]